MLSHLSSSSCQSILFFLEICRRFFIENSGEEFYVKFLPEVHLYYYSHEAHIYYCDDGMLV